MEEKKSGAEKEKKLRLHSKSFPTTFGKSEPPGDDNLRIRGGMGRSVNVLTSYGVKQSLERSAERSLFKNSLVSVLFLHRLTSNSKLVHQPPNGLVMIMTQGHFDARHFSHHMCMRWLALIIEKKVN